ncbi:energy transducer TonB [Flavobacterium sp.]|uniref:energy transducer TonB n=1 Tax=Flavobacterium sp. TaxID=239 RepID=UPI002631B1CD|nr:energy transducer TonB [Flavobacterium sp.]
MKKITILIMCFLVGNLVFPKNVNTALEVPVQYDIVEVKPQFPGGITEFMRFVMKNYQVPEDEDGGGATGTLQVSIVIAADGSVTQVNILKEVGAAGKEVKRVLAKCPKWTPGRQGGISVPVVYNFPITIK